MTSQYYMNVVFVQLITFEEIREKDVVSILLYFEYIFHLENVSQICSVYVLMGATSGLEKEIPKTVTSSSYHKQLSQHLMCSAIKYTVLES